MSFSYYARLMFTLVVFLGGMILVLRYARQFQQKRYSGDIKIIDRVVIDSGAVLLIVEVKEERYLMSAGGKAVNILQKIV